MCQGLTKNGGRCNRRADSFCWQHAPKVAHGPNRGALEGLIGSLVDVPLHSKTLAQMLADELDRQVAVGEGLNAALVGRYVETLGVLTVDDDDGDPIADLFAKILDETPTDAAQQGRAG